MIDILYWVLPLGVLVVHWLLSRQRLPWLGAIVPALWVVAIVVLAVQGHLTEPLDWVFMAIGTVALVFMAVAGQESRKKRRA